MLVYQDTDGQEEDKEAKEMSLNTREQEEKHLEETLKTIDGHIEKYSAEVAALREHNQELYDTYRSTDSEMHNELVVGLSWEEQVRFLLRQNRLAAQKPYFGRIDYLEHGEDESFSLYIGKHGVPNGPGHPLVIDWRTPISTIYYDSDVGESSYLSPEDERIRVRIDLKRTFEIENRKLLDYYDTDVIANDDFLTKYLGKNKEAVLDEIIATIQKEQNDIIRDTPWHTVIVQGVAGSGKTTVAMHRISYILYNYPKKFRPEQFFVIGSNTMLLNYITGVLPTLEVDHVHPMTMTEFLESMLVPDWKPKKFHYAEDFRTKEEKDEHVRGIRRYKGSLRFVEDAENWLKALEKRLLTKEDAVLEGKTIFSQKEVEDFCAAFPNMPLQRKIDVLEKRLNNQLKNEYREREWSPDRIRKEGARFRAYYGKPKGKIDLWAYYMEFLTERCPELLPEVNAGVLDLYDIAVLALFKKRLRDTDDFTGVRHIVIDEAQDFGVSLFMVLRQLFPECTYTIVGDTSQNIFYDSGMNDWRTLREKVFDPARDRFCTLARSYRNTVEISNYAGQVLQKCTFETYQIDPILRHGRPVQVESVSDEEETARFCAARIQEIQSRGYRTIAVICRSEEEAARAQAYLGTRCEINTDPENFTNGVMVLPIHRTKGLEFDAVLLWNADQTAYPLADAPARLLYVAITRALHELYIFHVGSISPLLQ